MKQFNVRLPEVTIRRIKRLAILYGSQSKAIIAAVERLHKEIEMSEISSSMVLVLFQKEDGTYVVDNGGDLHKTVDAEAAVRIAIANLTYDLAAKVNDLASEGEVRIAIR